MLSVNTQALGFKGGIRLSVDTRKLQHGSHIREVRRFKGKKFSNINTPNL